MHFYEASAIWKQGRKLNLHKWLKYWFRVSSRYSSSLSEFSSSKNWNGFGVSFDVIAKESNKPSMQLIILLEYIGRCQWFLHFLCHVMPVIFLHNSLFSIPIQWSISTNNSFHVPAKLLLMFSFYKIVCYSFHLHLIDHTLDQDRCSTHPFPLLTVDQLETRIRYLDQILPAFLPQFQLESIFLQNFVTDRRVFYHFLWDTPEIDFSMNNHVLMQFPRKKISHNEWKVSTTWKTLLFNQQLVSHPFTTY